MKGILKLLGIKLVVLIEPHRVPGLRKMAKFPECTSACNSFVVLLVNEGQMTWVFGTEASVFLTARERQSFLLTQLFDVRWSARPGANRLPSC